MEANIEAIHQLIIDRFHGNKSYFCSDIGIDRSYFWSVEKNPKQCKKLIDQLSIYCRKNKLKIKDYIFFG